MGLRDSIAKALAKPPPDAKISSFRKKIVHYYRTNVYFREFGYIVKPFFDDNTNPNCVILNWFLQIPFLRLFIYKHKLKSLGENFKIRYPLQIAYGRNITIGKRASLGPENHLLAGPNSRIIIGDNIGFAPSVLLTSVLNGTKIGVAFKDQPIYEADVTIGDEVYIGVNSVIMPGVILGNGVIVGANTLVPRNMVVEDNMIVAGNPARVIASRAMSFF